MKETVLVFTKNQALAGLFSAMFSNSFDVEVILDEDHAEQALNKKPPSVFFADFSSLNHNHIRMLRIAKQQFLERGMIILAYCPSEEPSLIQLALEFGAIDIVCTPIRADIVLPKLQNTLALRSAAAIKTQHNEKQGIKRNESYDHQHKVRFELLIEEVLSTGLHIKTSDIAKKLSLSISTFERMIKKHYNQRPAKYIMLRKLQKADYLLKTSNITIKELAFNTGFNSTSYFIKCYKEAFGVSPNEAKKHK